MGYLENLLTTVFSGDVGLSESGIQNALSAIRENPDRREWEGIRAELAELLDRIDVDWISLLDNDRYEVVAIASPVAARQYVLDTIWQPLFAND